VPVPGRRVVVQPGVPGVAATIRIYGRRIRVIKYVECFGPELVASSLVNRELRRTLRSICQAPKPVAKLRGVFTETELHHESIG